MRNDADNIRNDVDNIRKVEQLRPRHENLKTQQIKLEHEIERRTSDVATAEAEAMEFIGTSNSDEIRDIITENWKANTEAVDTFESIIVSIENDLKALGEEPGSSPQPPRPGVMNRPQLNRG